jgi:CHAD domain-containing protein
MPKADTFAWDDALSTGANARHVLPDLVRTYYEAGRRVAAAAPEPNDLHRFRLRTKRLRYTVELFRICYGPGLERWLGTLRGIQNCLGAISDCITTRRLIAATLGGDSPGRQRLALFLDKRAARETSAFRRYWRTEFDKPGEARRWEAYFKRKTK